MMVLIRGCNPANTAGSPAVAISWLKLLKGVEAVLILHGESGSTCTMAEEGSLRLKAEEHSLRLLELEAPPSFIATSVAPATVSDRTGVMDSEVEVCTGVGLLLCGLRVFGNSRRNLGEGGQTMPSSRFACLLTKTEGLRLFAVGWTSCRNSSPSSFNFLATFSNFPALSKISLSSFASWRLRMKRSRCSEPSCSLSRLTPVRLAPVGLALPALALPALPLFIEVARDIITWLLRKHPRRSTIDC
mmetsp:Transcript_59262/g.111712  ORF Transcript_59262/g.111712 Transcript_59262/m.111712 type:complete len:245 (+) Transcript_59262:529-1263(+)